MCFEQAAGQIPAAFVGAMVAEASGDKDAQSLEALIKRAFGGLWTADFTDSNAFNSRLYVLARILEDPLLQRAMVRYVDCRPS